MLENPLQSLAPALHTTVFHSCKSQEKTIKFRDWIGSQIEMDCLNEYMVEPIPPDLLPRLRKFLKKRGHTEQMTWLGMYGAKTWKPVKLVSSSKEVQRLYRTACILLFSNYISKKQNIVVIPELGLYDVQMSDQ